MLDGVITLDSKPKKKNVCDECKRKGQCSVGYEKVCYYKQNNISPKNRKSSHKKNILENKKEN